MASRCVGSLGVRDSTIGRAFVLEGSGADASFDVALFHRDQADATAQRKKETPGQLLAWTSAPTSLGRGCLDTGTKMLRQVKAPPSLGSRHVNANTIGNLRNGASPEKKAPPKA